MLGYVMLFNFCFTMALSFFNREYNILLKFNIIFTCFERSRNDILKIAAAIGKPQAVIPEESYKGRTKKSIEQGSSKG